MMYIHLEHHISEALSPRTQSPHDNDRQSSAYSQPPAMHMGTMLSSVLPISHNIDRPRNAFGLHLQVSFLSEYKAEYREAFRLLRKYNAHHL